MKRKKVRVGGSLGEAARSRHGILDRRAAAIYILW
jgi:hypothetical protein